MRDALTVLQKELREAFGERYTRHGGLVQSFIVVLVLGVLHPIGAAHLWLAGSPLAIIYFVFFPGVLAVSVAADAFAGERERKTLETLLATPLTEGAILVGKATAAVLFALTVTVVAFACAVVSVNLGGASPSLFLPAPALIGGALGGAAASAFVMTNLAILISMKIPVSRSAQQMTSLLSIVVFGSVAAGWSAVGAAISWPNVFLAEMLLVAVGAVAFGLARLRFRRDEFFDRR
jgi:ABC-2 type transport system permease protein